MFITCHDVMEGEADCHPIRTFLDLHLDHIELKTDD